MYIVMHCGGLPFNGETLLKKGLGGSETAAYFVAKELAKRGHKVTLFTNSVEEGEWDGVRYLNMGAQSQGSPFGERFHFYAENTPHDVLIIQRVPHLVRMQFAAKVILCWQHDLALRRLKPLTWNAMWNVNALLAVSEWHRQQIIDEWGVGPEHIFVAPNGCDFVDDAPYNDSAAKKLGEGHIRLLYTSRPERGLENLIRPDAIMDELAKTGKPYHLYVCNYDNVTDEMRWYYGQIYERIGQMPNVTNLGHLTKAELREVMENCDALVYPSNFEETSCITAMEAAACGLPLIGSEVGALPETTRGGGAVLLPLDPKADDPSMLLGVAKGVSTEAFVREIRKLENREWRDARAREQLSVAARYTWEPAALAIERAAFAVFHAAKPETVAKHLVRQSDIWALKSYAETAKLSDRGAMADMPFYRFAFENKFKEHYDAYYQYEKDRGVNYGPENLDGNPRFEYVAGRVGNLPAGATVLDYGCAHGHYTVNLAKRFPDKRFVGVDLAQSNVDIARKWAADEKLSNIEFWQGGVDSGCLQIANGEGPALSSVDLIIAAEVLEHVNDPWDYVDTLARYMKDGASEMVLTTPFGPWEAQGYALHPGWRAHLHHFERADLSDCFGHHPRYQVTAIPSGRDREGDVVGSYVTIFGKPEAPSGRPNYARKLAELNPRQTLSVCMIVHNAESTLRKCLESVKEIADEIIIAIDEKTTDRSEEIAREYVKGIAPAEQLLFRGKSPTEVGFDAARNAVIARATSDWIMWIDADEELFGAENLFKYLRQNQFSAYAMAQHHFTVQPAGVLRTDYPTRLFRNWRGIRFFGVVHEHPELGVNKGIGHAMMINDAMIAHNGYSTESVRRGRFQRNIGLLVRDREKYPDRKLGKFLWLRDMAQMCGYELEKTGEVSEQMRQRAREGVRMWEDLLAAGEYRMIVDGMDFYNTCVGILTNGGGLQLDFKFDASKLNGGPKIDAQPTISGRFMSKDHAERLITGLINERVKDYESKHF